MPNARIDFPRKTDLESLFKFSIELDYYTQHDRIIIDMPEKSFCGPFAMLLIATKISHLISRHPNTKVVFNNWESHGYLSHMGFFSMCGFDHGKQVGEAWGSRNYVPISQLTRGSLIERDVDKYEEMQDLLQRRVDRVAEIIAHDTEKNRVLLDVLSYSLREVFRNVFEHGETDSLYYCAQYWPKSGKVEFSVSDFGVGVCRGLGTNPNFRFKSDKEAIEYALLPGVSGRTHQRRVSSNWFNSGYGLYMTSRLARNGGNFTIASGQDAIQLTPKTKTNFIASFPGTILRVNLDTSKIGDVQSRLSEFREEGKKIAQEIKGSGNRPPSAMSLLLRRDYESEVKRK
ncbi:hypothetical protein TG4357_00020 [Thalassovita gelatinovora]|uniref:Histidine kinase-, DNA gyrase B-, and HSP90-like ATPase n=1 Tax=Thalassovita gelatinovora TaxID=53501 RepID=A0A0P1F3Q5_THAGE|nr:hypothetical protein [Thalassovita gelatinovora]QIZ81776.1 hypothetical protein HFZ77_15480 [Thalassovita gelatinovora]CUH62332.1 hypothetical protein TG4357_00020 [Thalassovita gelatinovora]SER15872.1 hypothetical protein SAMN04488043_11821 [Thalassovita gelatinovora]